MKENVSGCFFSEHSVVLCRHLLHQLKHIVAALTQIYVNFCRLQYVIIGSLYEKVMARCNRVSSDIFLCRINRGQRKYWIYWRKLYYRFDFGAQL